jgi:predicted HD phosphohydrolase
MDFARVRTIFVRRASDDEICANNLLIDLGGIAVDENGDPESQKVIEKQVYSQLAIKMIFQQNRCV